jgi:purine nucleosidase
VHRILVDCDTGIDDAIALLYLADLMHRDEVELTAIGSVHGNVSAATGATNTLRVLELAGHDTVPVAVGAARPLAQELHIATDVHGIDGLGAIPAAVAAGRPVDGSAAEQLVRLARAHPGELTVLALGPLTNLGLALLIEPELPRLVREVVVMGGALDVAGNISGAAEANVWHDPEAAELVLAAGWPLVLVPLDASMSTELDADWLTRLAAADGPIPRFATDVLEYYVDFYSRWLGRRNCVIHDALAAMITVDRTIARYERSAVRVELRGEHTRGATVWDRRERIADLLGADSRPAVDVAVACDVSAFQERLFEALVARPHS